MKKINLKLPFLNLKGEQADANGTILLSDELGNVLAGVAQVEGVPNPAKVYDWALQLVNEGVLNVDDTDFKIVKTFVENNPRMSIALKGQILKAFEVTEK